MGEYIENFKDCLPDPKKVQERINEKNLCKLNSVRSESFACLTAVKKKPAKIINRLF